MSTMLYQLSSLISLSLAVGPTGDLTCNKEAWTVVSAEWEFSSSCTYENKNPINGAMSWIGDGIPESIQWSDYTIEMKMTPTNTDAGGANGGLAFNIQEVGQCSNCGHYYAISIFPKFKDDQVEIHMGKWNNNYQTVGTWFLDDVYTEGQAFYIKAEISTRVNVTANIYVDNVFLGTWIEDSEPMWKYGSIGMRNYLLPASFTEICVNGCSGSDSVNSGGGWIFIGIVLGGFFLYCCIGYIFNGYKGEQYFRNIKENIPHLPFWITVPKLVKVGCQVSIEFMRGVLCKKVGTTERLMETIEADENAGYDAEDQVL